MQSILIPGLGAAIDVTMIASFEPTIPLLAGGRDFSKKNYATYLLSDQKALTNLTVRAFLRFPQHTWKPAGSREPQVSWMYHQTVEGTFTNIMLADGKLTFSDPGPIDLEPSIPSGVPLADGEVALGTDVSVFRFIEGKAWLHTSNNASITVVKIKLVLGSQDVYVFTWEEGHEDAQVNFGVEAGGGGKDADEAGIGRVWDRFREGLEA